MFLFFKFVFETIDFNNICITLNPEKNKQTKKSIQYATSKSETGCFSSLQPKKCNFAKASLAKEIECTERESFNKCGPCRPYPKSTSLSHTIGLGQRKSYKISVVFLFLSFFSGFLLKCHKCVKFYVVCFGYPCHNWRRCYILDR